MRAIVVAAALLASSSLCSHAQDQGKTPPAQSETPASSPTADQKSPSRDQQAGRDQARPDEREMGRDWRLRRGDNERMDRDDRDFGHGMARRDEDERRGSYHDKFRERYWDRGDREWDRAERDYRGYLEESRPRRRVKICVEYPNGDEYCRYRE